MAEPVAGVKDRTAGRGERGWTCFQHGVGPKIAQGLRPRPHRRWTGSISYTGEHRWVQRALAGCEPVETDAARGLAEKVKSPGALREPTAVLGGRVVLVERFGRYAGYAGQYLFHWVEPHK